jgi:ComF family protein
MFVEKFISTLTRFIIILANYAQHFLLPPTCILCGANSEAHNICLPCHKSLPILSHHCPQCAHLLPTNTLCASCASNSPSFDHTYALFPYQPPVIRLITGLKFHHQLSHARLFGELLTRKIKQDWYAHQSLPDYIIPLPLHPKRLKERGFNQSLEFARPVSRSLSIPLDLEGASRIKQTSAQSGLSSPDRAQNMTNAFAVHRDYTGLFLAVVDDVMTTGQTLTAFCQVLKQAGAARIDVWCIARAMVDIAPKPKNR